MAELRKCRQQFLTYIKMHPPSDVSRIANMFVQYINNMSNWFGILWNIKSIQINVFVSKCVKLFFAYTQLLRLFDRDTY